MKIEFESKLTKTSPKSNSLRVRVPQLITKAMGLKPKDNMVWELIPNGRTFQIIFHKYDDVDINEIELYFDSKVYQNSAVLIITVPIGVVRALKLTPEDYIKWSIKCYNKEQHVIVTKL